VSDVRGACDLLAEVHESSKREFASERAATWTVSCPLEVSPRLAHDTEGTIAAAKRLFGEVDRPNVMIKIPATKEGLPAIRRRSWRGHQCHVTLIFSVERYNDVITAWRDGITDAYSAVTKSEVLPVSLVFVSRVDVAVDALLPEVTPGRGTTANAQAAAAYELYRVAFERRRSLNCWSRAPSAASPWLPPRQRTRATADLLYVDELVADETVNTMPEQDPGRCA